MADDWDEKRVDIIGSNGNDGLHYNKEKQMDEADLGNMQVELNEARSIAYARHQAQTLEVQPVGHCLYCGEPFPIDSQIRWCDKFCASGWEKEKALKR